MLLALLVLLAWPLLAQVDIVRANLTGTVLDPSGALVSEAVVTVSSRDTGFARRAVTGEHGDYSFHMLLPGMYQLRIQKLGFRVALYTELVLPVGQTVSLDPILEIGLVSQSIDINVPLINTAESNLGSEIAGAQVRELPLNIRNVFGLVSLDSSVGNSVLFQALNPLGAQGNVDQDVAFFNFGGGRFGTTAFLLDGHWNGAGDWDGIFFCHQLTSCRSSMCSGTRSLLSTAGAWGVR